MKKTLKLFVSSFFIILLLVGCDSEKHVNRIVVYTSVDQFFAEKIFRDFQKDTGIRVVPVYDSEASKGVGLEKRLIGERDHPKADIFWNSEPLRTIYMAKLGIFSKYSPKNNLPYKSSDFYDKEQGLWYGIGERQRVIVVKPDTGVSKKFLDNKLFDILCKKNEIAISSPFSGSTTTHMAALYARDGSKKFTENIKVLSEKDLSIVSGNSIVVDRIISGKSQIGLSDSDDVLSARKNGQEIAALCYDQDGYGNFTFFGTLSKVKHAPHPKNADRFMKFMLRKEIERKLISIGAVQSGLFIGTKDASCKGWEIPPGEIYNVYRKSILVLKRFFH